MDTVTIPKEEYKELKRRAAACSRLIGINLKDNVAEEEITEENILRWAREAKKLAKEDKLPMFKHTIKKDYPKLASKYKIK